MSADMFTTHRNPTVENAPGRMNYHFATGERRLTFNVWGAMGRGFSGLISS